MKEFTLRELCKECCVSRRAVQGYEKAGLIAAVKRNQRGYLLYEKMTVERVKEIRFLQDIGLTVKEITGIIDGPEYIYKENLRKQLAVLQREIEKRQRLISIIQRCLEEKEMT